ncbi:carboxypeptidase-like regulatory domain-containing protein [Tenacibaculum sp. L6]|uniref:carboxypeptidase-like regulatory domain-containing protein n=1 Tax=Tenacibaculum sp. L6 TaxID=2992764 RepID=UPI00237B6D39|nr:carboxypeptidase-like regulatory domain-containing protein [Tenacibaculum sp. L6]MDE0536745.1 carboxypeptidase-like regulatory domain-containing protein [Tenacibaculum sp. L6]
MIKQLPITLLLLLTLQITAQENRKFLYASVHDEVASVPNAHIINLNTKQGTFTNDNGEFRILTKPNDSLQVSFVGYETKIIKVETIHFGIEKHTIELKKIAIELDEVEVKKHYLTGSISLDIKQAPKDSIGDLVKDLVSDIKNMKVSDIMKMPDDELNSKKAPNMRKVIDPTAAFAGIGGSVSLGLDAYSLKLKRTRKAIKFKEDFPKMLLSEFGEHFFFEELKIPEDRYLHFLEYCNPLGIEKLYKDGNVLKLIEILRKESVSYLKTIHEKE